MINTVKTYEYQNNLLSIPASLLYNDWKVITYRQYERWSLSENRKLIRTKDGKGLGNEAFVSFYDLPQDIKQICIEKLGNPADVVVRNLLEPYILPDMGVANYFSRHRTPDGKKLSDAKQRQKCVNCFILNAIQMIFKEKGLSNKMFGKRKTKIWQNIADAVNGLNTEKWNHNLPVSAKRLKMKFEEYTGENGGYHIFIHKGEGNQLAAKLKGDVADWVLAKYSLPNKLTIPMLVADYEKIRIQKEWPELTREAIYNYLYNNPENRRIWTLARDGKEAYQNKYQHKISRDKSNWFPNIYWAIDGTKLDWLHFEPTRGNKMGADIRINVIFDVYSEKILGWSFSESETHLDHFQALKTAVQTAGCRPYLLTYDQQSGHKMARMQELYSNIVAKEGGTHYPHKARQHGSPVEQLFNRLQQQHINRFWFSDGQSITVRRDGNKFNPDFINTNKHLLKTKEELNAAWETVVKEWNNSNHPKFNQSRNEVYVSHEMPKREELNIVDVLQYMWLNETKPITYRREGLTIHVGEQSHLFEVYNSDGSIDIEFRRKNVGRKFIVRYDPDNMDVFVQLMEKDAEGNMVFVSNAEPKRMHENIPVLMEDGDKEQWYQDFQVREEEYERDLKAVRDLYARTGISPEKMIAEQELNIKFRGNVPKQAAMKADSLEDEILNRM